MVDDRWEAAKRGRDKIDASYAAIGEARKALKESLDALTELQEGSHAIAVPAEEIDFLRQSLGALQQEDAQLRAVSERLTLTVLGLDRIIKAVKGPVVKPQNLLP